MQLTFENKTLKLNIINLMKQVPLDVDDVHEENA